MNSKEIWKDVKGYEGLYQISDKGSLKHYSEKYGWNVLKSTNQFGWYFTIILRHPERPDKTVRIHRLVAEAFIGEIPKGYHVHHKDGNKQNNEVSNLEIIHPSAHAAETKKQIPDLYKGMNHYNQFERPKRVRQYTMDGEYIAEYANIQIAGSLTGVCARNIHQVASQTPYNAKGCTRRQAGGFIWKYADEGKGVAL